MRLSATLNRAPSTPAGSTERGFNPLYLVVISIIALHAMPSPVCAQANFTKVTTGDIVNDFGDNGIPAWGDFNNDGFLDLFVSDYGGTNALYLNNRNGTFTRITQGDPLQDADFHIGSVSGDFDNDGNLDLLVPVGGGANPRNNQLFHGNGDGSFTRASGDGITSHLGYFGPSASADYDNDGFLDIVITSYVDANFDGAPGLLFHNNEDGTFSNTASPPLTSDTAASPAAVWADYNNDGFMDLLVVDSTTNSVNLLYLNNGNGTFTRILTNAVGTDRRPDGAHGAAWGDYDNDGYLDLFVTTLASAQNQLYHNNGDGTFTNIPDSTFPRPAPDVNSTGCAWGDYDNDGFLDLFIASGGQARNQLFHNNGDGTFTEILSDGPGNDWDSQSEFTSVSWVDYDNDGFLDLYVRGGLSIVGGFQNLLYHNDGNSNAWLEVKCLGTVSNRSAIGAKVRVRATIGGKTFWQLREINQGGEYSTSPLVAHFGLGDATNADTVRIEWPSGTVQEFQKVAARQILTISEPPRLLPTITNGAPQFFIHGGRNLQYDIQSSTDLIAWSSIGTLTITNVHGIAPIIDTNMPIARQTFYRALSP